MYFIKPILGLASTIWFDDSPTSERAHRLTIIGESYSPSRSYLHPDSSTISAIVSKFESIRAFQSIV